ncbi:GntR family transcriptional regulator [Enterovibrio calviensis]|uniref:GntR family transcriptional regulator n=1 Tax=Enterovibrio calviensis TaxID=91359 RepID=UPI000484E618|nr:GntR family transcriptional regulator [Enterovibrio calviensis]
MSILSQSRKEVEINRIIDAISQAVSDQRLPPGTRLVEGQLVETFGANRNHVRSAIQRLALRRIVTVLPNKGASVSEPTLEEANDVLSARALVEQGIIENLVGRATDLDLSRLKRHVQKEVAARDKGSRREIIKLSGDFHILLAVLNGNRVLTEILTDLITRSSLIIALYQRDKQLDCGCHDHEHIIHAIANGEKGKAIDLMRTHLQQVESGLNLAFWKNRTVDLDNVFSDS